MGLGRINLFLTEEANRYQELLNHDAVLAAARHGFELERYFCRLSIARQIEQVRDAVRRSAGDRPRALIVLPAQEGHLSEVAREAVEAGIAWVVLNRRASFLERLPSEYPELPIFAVSPDDIEIGKIQGRQLRAVLPRGGRALLVRGGTATSTTTERDAGLRSALRGAGIELDVLYGSWTQQAARNALDVYLRTPGRGARRLDAVVCQSDDIAVGTLAALRAAAERQLRPELERIPVLGCDGLPSVGRSLVTNGSLRGTVLVPSTTGPAIDTLARAFTHRITPPAELVLECVPFPA